MRGPQGDLELIRGDNRAEEILRIKQAVLGACHEYEALDFEEVGELSGVRLPHADRVGFLVRAGDQRAQVGDQREVVCWV